MSTKTESRIVNKPGSHSKLVAAFEAGNSVVLDKHYRGWKRKRYPSFSLVGFTKTYHRYTEVKGLSKAMVKEFDPGRHGQRFQEQLAH